MSCAEGRGTERCELMRQGPLASPRRFQCGPALRRRGLGAAACCSPAPASQTWTLGDTIRTNTTIIGPKIGLC